MRALGVVIVMPLAALLVSFAAEHEARACSGCGDTSEVAPSNGIALPANAIGIAWDPATTVAEQDPVLYDDDTGLALSIVRHDAGPLVFIYPLEPAEPGTSYRFETPQDDCSGPLVRTLVATDPAPFSEVPLGTLVAEAATLGSVDVPADISCYEPADAVRVQIELQLAPELEPFADALMYETYMDGERWTHTPSYFHETTPGSSWTGQRGEDRLVELCFDGVGGSPTPHLVQMKARILGFPEIVLESNPVEVVLDCSMAAEGEDDSGSGTNGDGPNGDGPNGDETNGGETNGGETNGGETSGGDTSGGEQEDGDGGGCGCRSRGPHHGPMALLVPLALACIRRRW